MKNFLAKTLKMDIAYMGRARMTRQRRTTRRVLPKGAKATAGQKARLTRPVAKAVASVAKRVISRKAETKYVTRMVENNVAHNSAIAAGDLYRVFPQVASGNAEYQRVGDKISPQSLTLKGTVAISRSDGITARNSALMVRLVVLQLKSSRTYSTAPGVWTGGAYQRLLKRNDDAAAIENVQFEGNQNELYYPINRDDFDVLGERFIKLTSLNPAGETPGENSVEAAPINTIARNFNIKLKCPKTIKYDTTGTQDPAYFAPFLCVGYAYMDGAAPDVVDTRVIVSAQSHLYFKDM